MQPIVIGVAGGTGSGKTTVVCKIVDSLGDDAVSFIQHDFYYKDHPEPSLEDRGALKYDHPDVRFIRRLQRDLEARGRTLGSVIEQYQRTVRPMHLKFVNSSSPVSVTPTSSSPKAAPTTWRWTCY